MQIYRHDLTLYQPIATILAGLSAWGIDFRKQNASRFLRNRLLQMRRSRRTRVVELDVLLPDTASRTADQMRDYSYVTAGA